MSIKRILTLLLVGILAVSCLLSLSGCNDEGFYDPIKSSKSDRRVIATIGDEDVKYELFRYVFMSRINEYDGGDRSLWSGDGADALWQDAKEDVIEEICEIYAVFDVCRDWGIDPEGDNIEAAVNLSIKQEIDGGYLDSGDGIYASGYGSVDAYKTALAEQHCTDAVRRLLYRYKACLESLDNFIVDNHAQGEATVTDSALLTFSQSDNCAHINRVFVPFDSFSNNREAALENAQKWYNKLKYLVTTHSSYSVMVDEVFSQAISSVSSDPSAGVWYGKLSTSERDYPDYYNAIFSTPEGQISEIIEEWDGFYIVYGMSRNVDLTNTVTKSTLASLYFEEIYWGDIREKTADYTSKIVLTNHFSDVTPISLTEEE